MPVAKLRQSLVAIGGDRPDQKIWPVPFWFDIGKPFAYLTGMNLYQVTIRGYTSTGSFSVTKKVFAPTPMIAIDSVLPFAHRETTLEVANPLEIHCEQFKAGFVLEEKGVPA